jgi:hypothetical protein
LDGKYGKEQGPRGDIPWKSMLGVRTIPSIGLGNLGNVCGIGLLPASSLHRITCVSMICLLYYLDGVMIRMSGVWETELFFHGYVDFCVFY